MPHTHTTQLCLPLLERTIQLTSTPNFNAFINNDVELKCTVVSEPSPVSRYAVTWRLQENGNNEILVTSDRDALVTYGPMVVPSYRQRISVKRTKGPSFELKLHQVQMSDNGSYVCDVEEWLQDPHGDWYKLQPKSKTIQISVTEPGKLFCVSWINCGWHGAV